MTKVVGLLKTMRQQVEKEMKQDQEVYDKMESGGSDVSISDKNGELKKKLGRLNKEMYRWVGINDEGGGKDVGEDVCGE